MALEAGRLRHRVTFESRTEEQDPESGGIEPVWATEFEDVPAAIEPISASEFLAAGAVQSRVVARITVRYRPGLEATRRILHGSRIYNIEGVLPDKDSGLEYVTIPCSEGTNDG